MVVEYEAPPGRVEELGGNEIVAGMLMAWLRTEFPPPDVCKEFECARVNVFIDPPQQMPTTIEPEFEGTHIVIYGRCPRCGSNWSTGLFNVDTCPLCVELRVALAIAGQRVRPFGVRVKMAVRNAGRLFRWLYWLGWPR